MDDKELPLFLLVSHLPKEGAAARELPAHANELLVSVLLIQMHAQFSLEEQEGVALGEADMD